MSFLKCVAVSSPPQDSELLVASRAILNPQLAGLHKELQGLIPKTDAHAVGVGLVAELAERYSRRPAQHPEDCFRRALYGLSDLHNISFGPTYRQGNSQTDENAAVERI
jgi:hypothetical protein